MNFLTRSIGSQELSSFEQPLTTQEAESGITHLQRASYALSRADA